MLSWNFVLSVTKIFFFCSGFVAMDYMELGQALNYIWREGRVDAGSTRKESQRAFIIISSKA